MHPAVVSLHACRSAGRVGDFLPLREDVGFPWLPLSLISDIRYNVTHSKLPLY